ncbi:MAG: hypothetical protein JKY50_18715 [Oleispira sp.]|nr:hypothetical protein [Oleispira sp.]
MTLQQRLKQYAPAMQRTGKASLMVLLLIMLFFALVAWIDNLSGEALLPLPYLWWAIGLRIGVTATLIHFLPAYRWLIVIISLINEVQLYWLYGQALEGLLW